MQDLKKPVNEEEAEKGRINFANKYVMLLTKTAVLLAVTIVLQYAGHYAIPGIGGVIFVGTIVNMCLYVAAVSLGLVGGAVVAFLTPFVAFLTGHMGFPPLIPFIGIANYSLIVTVFFLQKIKMKNKFLMAALIIVAASAIKFGAMYGGVYNIAGWLGAKPTQMTAFQLNFSWPQIVAAAGGGILSMPILYGLKKARVL